MVEERGASVVYDQPLLIISEFPQPRLILRGWGWLPEEPTMCLVGWSFQLHPPPLGRGMELEIELIKNDQWFYQSCLCSRTVMKSPHKGAWGVSGFVTRTHPHAGKWLTPDSTGTEFLGSGPSQDLTYIPYHLAVICVLYYIFYNKLVIVKFPPRFYKSL